MRPLRSLGALAFALLAVFVLVRPAGAAPATVTITLSINGPNPADASAAPNDKVVFSNPDGVTHTISSSSKNWTFKKAIGSGQSATVTFPSVGTYAFHDEHVVIIDQVNNGTITVSVPKASPSPSVSGSPKPSASPTRSSAPKPSGAATPTPTPTGGAGTAVGPGLGSAVIPTATPPPTGGPAPNIAPVTGEQPNGTGLPASGSPSPAPNLNAHGLVQGSAHRYGLPAALAVVAITGVASLLVRLLLAQPAAASDRPDA